MIKNLLNWFGPKSADTIKSCPTIQGHVTIQLLDHRGKVKTQTEGHNIWTLTGREYLSELIALRAFSTAEAGRGLFRNDRVAYIGMGVGSQPEVSSVSSLVAPVSYDTGSQGTGTFLAVLDTPSVFPASSSSSAITAVQFSKTFDANHYSVGNNSAIVLTEAGLYTDGDPSTNFAVGGVSPDWIDSSFFAPVAYKAFEPITKTPDFTMKVVWEVRFL